MTLPAQAPGAGPAWPRLALDALDPAAVEALLEDEETRDDTGDGIRCAACGQRITTGSERIERDGGHCHTFTNPTGFEYHIGLFLRAPGCRAQGHATEAWTWFPGYAWQVVVCAGCAAHLGWAYSPTGAGEGFHGLILERLVSEQ